MNAGSTMGYWLRLRCDEWWSRNNVLSNEAGAIPTFRLQMCTAVQEPL